MERDTSDIPSIENGECAACGSEDIRQTSRNYVSSLDTGADEEGRVERTTICQNCGEEGVYIIRDESGVEVDGIEAPWMESDGED